MIRLGPKIDEEVRKAAEQNRAAGGWVAESPIKPLILDPEEAARLDRELRDLRPDG